MDYALIKGGVVVNVIIADQAFIDASRASLDAEQIVALDETTYVDGQRASPGWTYKGGKFSRPAGA